MPTKDELNDMAEKIWPGSTRKMEYADLQRADRITCMQLAVQAKIASNLETLEMSVRQIGGITC